MLRLLTRTIQSLKELKQYLLFKLMGELIIVNSKTVFTIHNNKFTHKFGEDLLDKVKMLDIDDSMLDQLKTADYEGFIKMGMQFADAVIHADEDSTESFKKLVSDLSGDTKVDTIESTENFEESYYNLYNDLVG